MRNIFLLFVIHLFFGLSSVYAQKYYTRDGTVRFFSETPLEAIEASNNKLSCVFDLESGKLQLAVLIKAFHFKRALMEEHFNENYMESDKYPKAGFSGRVLSTDASVLLSGEELELIVEGDLTMHGVTNPVQTKAIFVFRDNKLKATTSFILSPEDYDIKIPGIVRDKIAKNIEVHIDLDLVSF